jgi:hypothetical protein
VTPHVDGYAGGADRRPMASRADAAPTSPPTSVESLSKNATRRALRSSRGRFGRRFTDALLILVGVVAMVWLDRHRPNLTANQAPFPTRGIIGAAVRGRDFAITVDRVALTRALEVPGVLSSQPPQRRETDGVWLLVDARLEALREPTTLPGGIIGGPSLRTRDGAVYAFAGGRMPMGVPLLTNANAAPGMPARGVLVFELPLERVPGAVLVASRRVLSELDSTVEIDLHLTDDDVRRLASAMPASITLSRGAASW